MTDLNLRMLVTASTRTASESVREFRSDVEKIGTSTKQATDKAASGLARLDEATSTSRQGAEKTARTVGQLTAAVAKIEPAAIAAGAASFAGFRQIETSADRAKRSVEVTATAVADLTRAGASIRDVLGGVLVAGAAKELASSSDDYALFTGRILNSAESTAELRDRQRELVQVSQDNGQALATSAALYTKTAGSIRDLTGDTRDAIRFTDLVAKSFRVSGASQSEAAGASQQLAQALQSGVLRGDEFNSVNEQGGRLIQALADGLGVARGELRGMADDGKLTADVVLPALLSQIGQIDAEARNLPITFDQVGARIGNSFSISVNQATLLQAALGGVKSAADAIGSSSGGGGAIIDIAATTAGVLVVGRLVTILRAAAVAAGVGGGALAGFSALVGGPVTIAIVGASAALALLLNLIGTRTEAEVTKADDSLARLQARFEALQKTPADISASAAKPLSSDQQREFRAAGLRVAELNREIEHLEGIKSRFGGDAALEERLALIRGEAGRLTDQMRAVGAAANDALKGPAKKELADFLKQIETPAERAQAQLKEYREKLRATGGAEDPVIVARIIASGNKGSRKSVKDENVEALRSAIGTEGDMQRLVQSLLTPVERFRRELALINQQAEDGTLAEVAQRLGTSVNDVRNRRLQQAAEVLPQPIDDEVEQSKQAISSLVPFAEQAARNVQDAFATFLFDPLEGGLRGFLLSFVNTLRQAAAQAASSSILNSLFGGLAGSGNGIFAAIGRSFGGNGGAAIAPGSLLGITGIGGAYVGGRAGGGLIRGPGSSTSDSILARVSNEEYIVNAAATRRVGVGFLDAVNEGRMPGFADGGLVAVGSGGAGARFGAGLAPIVVQVDARNSTDPVQTAQLVARAVREAAVAFDKRRARGMRAGD